MKILYEIFIPLRLQNLSRAKEKFYTMIALTIDWMSSVPNVWAEARNLFETEFYIKKNVVINKL